MIIIGCWTCLFLSNNSIFGSPETFWVLDLFFRKAGARFGAKILFFGGNKNNWFLLEEKKTAFLRFSIKLMKKCWNKAIEEICGKSTWHDSFSRLAAVTRIFSTKQKTRFYMRSMRVCVPNIRSVSFFVWPGDVTEINTYTNTQIYKWN